MMDGQFVAVPDPDRPAVPTYWRRHGSGALTPWPKGARYGPQMPWVRGRSVREQLRAARWASEHFRRGPGLSQRMKSSCGRPCRADRDMRTHAV